MYMKKKTSMIEIIILDSQKQNYVQLKSQRSQFI